MAIWTPQNDQATGPGCVDEAAACANAILAQVPARSLTELLDAAEIVPLKRGDRFDYWATTDRVLFPLSGILGGTLETPDGDCIQPVFVGSQGVVGGMRAVHGMPFFLFYKVRLAGEAIAVTAAVVRSVAASSPTLQMALSRAHACKFRLAASNALCSRFHPLGMRCCAWLEIVHGEADGDIIPITHEELAEVVGATRPAVSSALAPLARQGLIASVGRGSIRILKPDSIARLSCECLQTPHEITAEWDETAQLLHPGGFQC